MPHLICSGSRLKHRHLILSLHIDRKVRLMVKIYLGKAELNDLKESR